MGAYSLFLVALPLFFSDSERCFGVVAWGVEALASEGKWETTTNQPPIHTTKSREADFGVVLKTTNLSFFFLADIWLHLQGLACTTPKNGIKRGVPARLWGSPFWFGLGILGGFETRLSIQVRVNAPLLCEPPSTKGHQYNLCWLWPGLSMYLDSG